MPTSHELLAADRLMGRRIRVGVFRHGTMAIEAIVETGDDIVLGSGGEGVLAVPSWVGPQRWVIRAGRWLELGPGMHVHMCHETGEDRWRGSYDDLLAAGKAPPIYINVSRLNIAIGGGLVVLVDYVLLSGRASES